MPARIRPSITTPRLMLALVAALLLVPPAPVATPPMPQDTVLRLVVDEENFRAIPNGTRIAVLKRGAELAAGAQDGRWREGRLQGWVRAEQLLEVDRDGYHRALATGGAEILDSPEGEPVARGLGGLLLEEMQRRDGWVEVARTAWIWAESVEEADRVGPAPGAGDGAGVPQAGAGRSEPRVAFHPVLSSPGGDTLAMLKVDAAAEELARVDGWVRVRVEGWVPASAAEARKEASPIRDLTLERLRADPERYRGRRVVWTLEFVSLRQADELRADLPPGETFVLARNPNGSPGFVYLLVPRDRRAEVERLTPLERFEVLGRIREPRSAVTGHAVIDLISLRPLPAR